MSDQVAKQVHRKGSAPPGFERMSALSARIGFNAGTIRSWIVTLNFPAPVLLNQRIALYDTAKVNAWLSELGLLQANGGTAQ